MRPCELHWPPESTIFSPVVTAQNGGTILPIANLMADSASGSPSSYSHFIVTTDLPHLVSEIFACDRDRQTGGWTMRIITIAGPHIAAGQLTNGHIKVKGTATGNHIPYGITQCYLPPGTGDFPAFTLAEADIRFSDPKGMQG